MEYCILKNVTASCSICNESHRIFTTIEPFKQHVINRHTEIYKNTILYGDNNWIWKFIYITNHEVPICGICKITCAHMPIPDLTSIKNHLRINHYINNIKARHLCQWVRSYVTELSIQKKKCRICENVYDQNNSYNLMLHLVHTHYLIAPRGIEISEE